MKLSRRAGATSQILQIFVADSSSTTGAGLTGLTNASSGLTAYFHRDTDTTATAISIVTMTAGTFTSGGFKEIDATNMPGWYQFCPPNTALASGAASVAFHLKGVTNMAPLPIEMDLDSQVDVYLWNGTAVSSPATAGIPDINVKNINNVAAATPGASGGMLISGSNSGTTTLGALTCTGSFTISDGLLVARSTSNTSAITATGNGTGSGLVATSGAGATGDGIQATAASTNGNGIKSTGTGTGSGELATGGTTGNGIKAQSGAGVTGDGILAVSNATAGNGITMTHAGTGKDLNATTTPLTLAKTTNITGFNDITAAATATAVWQDTTVGDFTVASSIGKSLFTSGVVPGANGGIFIAGTNAATTVNFTGSLSGSVGSVSGNVSGSVGSVTGLTASNLDATISSRLASASYTAPDNTSIAAIKTQTDKFVFTVANQVDANVITKTGFALTSAYDPAKTAAQAGDAMALTAAYDAAKTAATQASVNSVKTQTDKMTFTVANQIDSNIQYVNDIQVNGNGQAATPWGP